jgi:hypothetical protein
MNECIGVIVCKLVHVVSSCYWYWIKWGTGNGKRSKKVSYSYRMSLLHLSLSLHSLTAQESRLHPQRNAMHSCKTKPRDKMHVDTE